MNEDPAQPNKFKKIKRSGVQEGRNKHIPTADSCQYMAETNTVL